MASTTSQLHESSMTKTPADILIEATQQNTVAEAVDYISEGHFIDPSIDRTVLLRALCSSSAIEERGGEEALRQLAREVASSDLNTAALLLHPDLITPPSFYHSALDTLANKCGGSLAAGVTVERVITAQRQNKFVLATLGAVAGLAWTDVVQRADLPKGQSLEGPWQPERVQAVFELVDDIVCDRVQPGLSSGIVSRPIEMLGDPDVRQGGTKGWAAVEAWRTQGIPYATLLAQRVEGGPWRRHRDRTGGKYSHVLADALCDLLDEAGVTYHRTKNCGGDLTRQETEALVKGSKEQAALLIMRGDEPRAVVAISVANDGGSAAKSGARLKTLPERVSVPVYGLVAGLGWQERNETATLARALNGRLFSDRNLRSLSRTLEDV